MNTEMNDREVMSIFIVLLGGLVLIIVGIFFITFLYGTTVDRDSLQQKMIEERIARIGTVATVDKHVVPATRTTEQIYQAVCAVCHASGVQDAPRFGVLADWEPRMQKGMVSLVSSAANGIGVMPAKGGDISLSDTDLQAVIRFMLPQ